jgi:hypothetical protein
MLSNFGIQSKTTQQKQFPFAGHGHGFGKPWQTVQLFLVNTFHLWCSSNSLKYDFVQLRLFQRTLIGGVEKWYIELDGSRYSYFNDFAMVFLNNFQLPMRYDADTELLAKFEQTKDNHIFSHIREWKHRKILIKVKIPPDFFLERFLKSLVSCISKYIANFSVFSKEEAIMKSQ